MNLGEGALDVKVYEYALMPVLLFNDKLNQLLQNKISQRNIANVFEELGVSSPEDVSLDKVKPDRRELDKIVMGDTLGLTDEEQLEVYRAVVDLVKSRIDKAKSTDKKKKTKEGIDIELLVRTILSRIEEQALGKFYKEKILSQPCYQKALPEMKGKSMVEKDLFRWRLSGDNTYIECESEIEANYLKNFVGTGLTVVKIPKDKKYLKGILPELEQTRQNIDIIIEEDILSMISPKT